MTEQTGNTLSACRLSALQVEGYTLRVYCSNGWCRHIGNVDLAAVLAKRGDLTFGELLAKLKCAECGGGHELAIGLFWRRSW